MKHGKSAKAIFAILSLCLLLASIVLYTGTEETKDSMDKIALSKKELVAFCETYCERFKDGIEFIICMDGCKAGVEQMKRKKNKNVLQ